MRTWPCLARVSPFQTASWLNVRPQQVQNVTDAIGALIKVPPPRTNPASTQRSSRQSPPVAIQSISGHNYSKQRVSQRTSDNHRHIHAGDVLNSHARSQRISSRHTPPRLALPRLQPPRVPIARPRIQSSAERAVAPCRLTEQSVMRAPPSNPALGAVLSKEPGLGRTGRGEEKK